MPQLVAITTKRVPLAPSAGATLVHNTSSSATLYVGDSSVSSTSYDFAITAGSQAFVQGPAYAVGSGFLMAALTSAVGTGDVQQHSENRFWVGGVPVKAASGGGTNTTVTANTVYVGAVEITMPTLVKGAGYLVGTTGGTHKAITILYDKNGIPLRYSAVAGTTVGTANTYHELDFTKPIMVSAPGRYFLGVVYSGTTPTLQLQDGSAGNQGQTSVVGGNAASAADFTNVPVKVSMPTTVGKVPIMYTY